MTDHDIHQAARAAFDQYAAMDKGEFPADDMAELQVVLARWQAAKLSQPLGSAATNALGMGEEVGELNEMMLGLAMSVAVGRIQHAVLKHSQGIRGMGDIEALRVKAGDAIADAMIFATQLCTALRIDFGTLYRMTVAKVIERDWKADPDGAANGEIIDGHFPEVEE